MRLDPNIQMVETVASALGSLRPEVVFLGGCAAGLLLTDPAASCIRPTRDVDVIVEVTSRRGYREVEKALAERGFKHDTREGAPICRWVLDSVILDVMPTDSSILGFSNPWYADAFKTSILYILPGGLEIRLVSPPCFLATKLEAFFGRGQSDYYGSHDLEDLVAVIDGRPEIVAEVHAADPVLRKYLKQAMEPLLQDPQFCYALQGHLPGDSGSQARLPELMRRMKGIAGIPTTNSLKPSCPTQSS